MALDSWPFLATNAAQLWHVWILRSGSATKSNSGCKTSAMVGPAPAPTAIKLGGIMSTREGGHSHNSRTKRYTPDQSVSAYTGWRSSINVGSRRHRINVNSALNPRDKARKTTKTMLTKLKNYWAKSSALNIIILLTVSLLNSIYGKFWNIRAKIVKNKRHYK